MIGEPDHTPAPGPFLGRKLGFSPAHGKVDGEMHRDPGADQSGPSGRAPPRPDLPPSGDGPARPDRTGEPGEATDAPPQATWRPLEAIPVFIIALVAASILAIPISVLGCSARFDLLTLAGEVAFFATTAVWVRYVNHAPLAALGKSRQPLLDVGT